MRDGNGRMNELLQILKPRLWLQAAILAGFLVGCSQQHVFVNSRKQSKEEDRQLLKQVSYEEIVKPVAEQPGCVEPQPFALDSDPASVQYWDLTLDGAIQMALANSTVLRDLGARIIQSPTLTQTIFAPSVQSTDPRF